MLVSHRFGHRGGKKRERHGGTGHVETLQYESGAIRPEELLHCIREFWWGGPHAVEDREIKESFMAKSGAMEEDMCCRSQSLSASAAGRIHSRTTPEVGRGVGMADPEATDRGDSCSGGRGRDEPWRFFVACGIAGKGVAPQGRWSIGGPSPAGRCSYWRGPRSGGGWVSHDGGPQFGPHPPADLPAHSAEFRSEQVPSTGVGPTGPPSDG